MTTRIRFFGSPLRAAFAFLALAVTFVTGVAVTHSQTTPVFHLLYSFGPGHLTGGVALLPTPGGVLYGTASYGGCATCGGGVFRLTSDGAENTLHLFGGGQDGYMPQGGLVRDSYNNLFGTTLEGGGSTACENGCGVVYEVNQWGGETVLHRFAGGISDGANPRGALVLDEAGNLYGTTTEGGAFGFGTVFMVAKDGTESVLYSFNGKEDGRTPYAGLARDSYGNLYGTTISGGAPDSTCLFRAEGGCGVVFMLSKAGKETVLYSFTGRADGGNSQAQLVRDSAGRLYGTTTFGGASGDGTVFVIESPGKETVLYSFKGTPDGYLPYAGVIRDSAGNLYGTTLQGGTAALPYGTAFELSPSGQETILHSFSNKADGANPAYGGLSMDAAGNLFGTNLNGGNFDQGAAFRIAP